MCDKELISTDINCPYCDVLLTCYFHVNTQIEVCFGCDQPFVLEWNIYVEHIREIVGYKKVE